MGVGYTSKHNRLVFNLEPQPPSAAFQAAFEKVAAYRVPNEVLGKIIESIQLCAVPQLLASDWEAVLIATQSGTWPGPPPGHPSEALALVQSLGLKGFLIHFQSQKPAWVLARQYVRLGRR
jgi:hypothetical protein